MQCSAWIKFRPTAFPAAFNSFVRNTPFLYPLKTPENFAVFWYFQGVEKDDRSQDFKSDVFLYDDNIFILGKKRLNQRMKKICKVILFNGTVLFFCPLKKIRKPKVSWSFQGVYKKTSRMKWVNIIRNGFETKDTTKDINKR